jgi:hypothetical protein
MATGASRVCKVLAEDLARRASRREFRWVAGVDEIFMGTSLLFWGTYVEFETTIQGRLPWARTTWKESGPGERMGAPTRESKTSGAWLGNSVAVGMGSTPEVLQVSHVKKHSEAID